MKLIKGKYSKIDLTPNFRLFPFYFMKILNGLYVRWVEGITSIDISETDTLIDTLNEFQSGDTRLIVTFRHPTRHDPPLLMRVIHTLIPRRARTKGVELNRITHGHFVYGRWLLTWANRLVKWLFPGIGAIPVNNRSRDLKGIRKIRELLVSGRFPLFIAPEGQVTYHNEKCGPLENGVSSMALWCREDLNRIHSDSKVKLLPLTLFYDYTGNREKGLNKVLKKMNKELNRSNSNLIDLTKVIIDRIEEFYIDFYNIKVDKSSQLNKQIENLVDMILKRGESYFSIEGEGSFLDRTLTIRQAGLSNIDFSDRVSKLPGKEHGDHLASECYSILRHMEIADILQYIDPTYIESESLNRKIEYSLNLLDLLNRFNGGNINTRFSGLKKRVIVKTGTPIIVGNVETRGEKRKEEKRVLERVYSELQTLSTFV